jgi:hypothetical protein
MSALKSNQQVSNVLKRSSPSDSVDDTNPPPAKRSRLGDPTVDLTAAELRAATKEELIAHIIATQKAKKTAPGRVTAPTTMTPAQIVVTVDNIRKMMIQGIKRQLKV